MAFAPQQHKSFRRRVADAHGGGTTPTPPAAVARKSDAVVSHAQTNASLLRRCMALEHELADLRKLHATETPPHSTHATPQRTPRQSGGSNAKPTGTAEGDKTAVVSAAAQHHPAAPRHHTALRVHGARPSSAAPLSSSPSSSPPPEYHRQGPTSDKIDRLIAESSSWPLIPVTWYEGNEESSEAGFVAHAVAARICPESFGHGAFRTCSYLVLHPDDNPHTMKIATASAPAAPEIFAIKVATDNDVAPPPVAEHNCFSDVRMQTEAARLADLYNARGPPKRVQFLPAAVVYFSSPSLVKCNEANASDDDSSFARFRAQRYAAVEPLVPGDYTKWSNNLDYVSPLGHMTPLAFSHFTFEATEGSGLVCDIQGVQRRHAATGTEEYLFTDPQIHGTLRRWGKGDLGREGMRMFFTAHRCNDVCRLLGLTPSNTTSAENNDDPLGETASIAAASQRRRHTNNNSNSSPGERQPQSAAHREEPQQGATAFHPPAASAVAEAVADVADVAERARLGHYREATRDAAMSGSFDGSRSIMDRDAAAHDDYVERLLNRFGGNGVHRHSRFLWGSNTLVNTSHAVARIGSQPASVVVEADLPEFDDDAPIRELREGRAEAELGTEDVIPVVCHRDDDPHSSLFLVRRCARNPDAGFVGDAMVTRITVPATSDDTPSTTSLITPLLDERFNDPSGEAYHTVHAAAVVLGGTAIAMIIAAKSAISDDTPHAVPRVFIHLIFLTVTAVCEERSTELLPPNGDGSSGSVVFDAYTLRLVAGTRRLFWIAARWFDASDVEEIAAEQAIVAITSHETATTTAAFALSYEPLGSRKAARELRLRHDEDTSTLLVAVGGPGAMAVRLLLHPGYAKVHRAGQSGDDAPISPTLRLPASTAVSAATAATGGRGVEHWLSPVHPWSRVEVLCSVPGMALAVVGFSTGEVACWCTATGSVLQLVPAPAMEPKVSHITPVILGHGDEAVNDAQNFLLVLVVAYANGNVLTWAVPLLQPASSSSTGETEEGERVLRRPVACHRWEIGMSDISNLVSIRTTTHHGGGHKGCQSVAAVIACDDGTVSQFDALKASGLM
jgi:hypothetical protein